MKTLACSKERSERCCVKRNTSNFAPTQASNALSGLVEHPSTNDAWVPDTHASLSTDYQRL